MSRISKWKLEKNKVKVVFRLQFHATHVPQTGWDKLFISFIPTDTGKATAKTTKANIRNGTCKWADPIYETTRLLQDSKTKQYDEKLYKIVVAMGSSRSSTLGEATINLADYVDALKPSAVSLPLHGCNFGTVLHITVQLLTSKTGFREFEQQRELRETGLQPGVDSHSRKIEEVSARVKLKAEANELSSLEEEANANEEYADSATGFDGSSNTSGSLYAEKHEIDSLKSPNTVKRDPSDHPNTSHGWGSDNSVDNEFTMVCEENNRLRGSLELAESSFFNLKLEVNSLQSLANELGAETQKFSHILAAEISSSEELAKCVSIMKDECVNLKDEIILLKELKSSSTGNQIDDNLVRNVQLQFSNGVSIVEGKIRELVNKAYVDGDVKYIYLEMEALLNFLSDFKLGNGDVLGNGLGLDLCSPESVIHNFTLTTPVSEVVNPMNAVDAMKGQIFDLVRELDEAKVEKEGLLRKMNQMECYYEALIHDLEENQKHMLAELQLLQNQHSSCLYTLSTSKAENESLRQEMNQQVLRFADEKRDLETLNEELERRTTASEAALRRARLNYSIAVDKLQKDLELLSSQVMSMFETNENIIKQALPKESGDHNSRKRSVGGDVLLDDLKKSFSMQGELYRKVEQELIEMYSMNLNLDIYSNTLQESLREACGNTYELAQKLKESESAKEYENGELSREISVLEEQLTSLKRESDQLMEENENLRNEKEIADVSLSSVRSEVLTLKQRFESSLSNSMMDKLQAELESVANKLRQSCEVEDKYAQQSGILLADLARLEDQMQEHLDKEFSGLDDLAEDLGRSKLTIAELMRDKQELAVFLQGKSEESSKLSHDFKVQKAEFARVKELVSILELEKLRLGQDLQDKSEESIELSREISALKDELHVLEGKLRDLTYQLDEDRDKLTALELEKSSLDGLVEELERSKLTITELMHDKQELVAHLQDKTEESVELSREISSLKDELKGEQGKVRDLTCQLDEDRDKLTALELEKSRLGEEILGFTVLAEEFGRSKLTIAELMRDKQELVVHLQDKTEESAEHSREITRLKDELKVLHDELLEAQVYRDELIGVKDLVKDLELEKSRLAQELSCLNALGEELETSKLTITELMREKQELTTLCLQDKSAESEISSLKDDLRGLREDKSSLLDGQNLFIEELKKNGSYLAELDEYSLAADVKFVYMENQYGYLLDELHQKLVSSESCLSRLQKRYRDTEAKWREEKSNLLMVLESSKSDKNQLEDLIVSKEELEILVIVLKEKVEEHDSYEHQLADLRSKLSEQVSKTEEYKNLSTRMKELKEKAEAECVIAREIPENEVPSFTVQDSLRIAFIKEQYESTIQELKQQLSISKKHGEEMLMKLQDAIDEVENRKKSEAMNLKRIDELMLRLSALEEELQSAVMEKRTKSKAYDRTKAELECALLSLECCKEEKEKLGASLLQFDSEKCQLSEELAMVKEQLKSLEASRSFEKDEYAINGLTTGNSSPNDSPAEEFRRSNGDNLGSQRLRSSIEHLRDELEKMKHENTIFDIDDDADDADPGFEVPETEIMQLCKANEELESMFPSFNEVSSGGNALERVLALEIELAEALKAKNKSSLQFQSSFLRQHSGDEEAIFKSFRDINDLIKETIELKKKHAAMKSELKEEHDRYSRLSLQFAEVEGERQKLKMTLRNVRSSKKLGSMFS